MDEVLIRALAKPIPRYTSYPTAPHFHGGIGPVRYAEWLAALPPSASLSLYAHIPFCDRLCWFCACHTKQTRRYEPVAAYLVALYQEISTVAGHLQGRGRVTSLHLGGGSPTLLNPTDMAVLSATLRRHFDFAGDAEISVEMDPNDITEERLDGLAEFGLTRASLGVQDFDPNVQAEINRIQTFEQTRAVVEGVRRRGVHSVNIDVLYGLPHQTVDSVLATLAQVLQMQPDRVALFGYAHVPWMKKHQTMINEMALPDSVERFRQARAAAGFLVAEGYRPIGIDHFARPSDNMAVAARTGTLKRNFQGYTTDGADALIGLGASSVGQLPEGYVQNVTATGEYMKRARAGELATAKGIALTGDDRIRAFVIERLMCDFVLSFDTLANLFGRDADGVICEAREIALAERDGLCEVVGNVFRITARGRPFARVVAARFDRYLMRNAARHSVAV